MDVTQLLEPVLTKGIRTTHFFNGRVLTAEDLRTEQRANRDQHRQLVRALGDGIVHGFDVTRSDPVSGVPALRIRSGLAFNRDGDAVALGRDVELLLVNRQTTLPPEAGLFAVCLAPDNPIELTNVGLYVLTARPASAFSQERAPMTELGSEGIAGGCGSRWAIEGVRFAVLPLPLAAAGTTPSALATELGALAVQIEQRVELLLREGDSATEDVRRELAEALSRLRNGAAYMCFGADQLAAALQQPLPAAAAAGFPDREPGAIAAMREREDLADCEVPLALLYLSKRGLEWVDVWAVRRSPVPALNAGTLPMLPSARALATATAMLLQFQQQVRELIGSSITTAQLLQIDAAKRFRFLPPVGLLPLREGSTGRGFNQARFFTGLAFGNASPLNGAKARRVAASALLHPPLDLAAGTASVELWRVRENIAGTGGTQPAPYLLFVTRETAGPAWRDTVALTLEAAWQAWRGVVRRRLFLPPGTDADKVAAQIAIVNVVRDVMDVAARESALAAAGILDDRAALDAYRRLHAVQNDVQQLFVSAIPGITHTQQRENFGAGLNTRLNTNLPGGGQALITAVNAGSLPGAVAAQSNINQFIAGWSGEGIAMGPLQVDYMGNTRGLNVVPGDTTGFPHHFRVRNGSTGTLTVTLTASVTGAAGDWSDATTIVDATGAPVSTFELASGAAVDVIVRVIAPATGTVADEKPLLTLRATVPAPNERDQSATQQLTVAAREGQAQLGSVTVIGPSEGGLPFANLDNAPPSTVGTFMFQLRFTGPDALPSSAEFDVTVTIDAADPTLWPAELTTGEEQTAPGVYVGKITLNRGQQHAVDVTMRTAPRGTSDRTATISVQAASTTLDAAVRGELDPPIALRVRAAT